MPTPRLWYPKKADAYAKATASEEGYGIRRRLEEFSYDDFL